MRTSASALSSHTDGGRSPINLLAKLSQWRSRVIPPQAPGMLPDVFARVGGPDVGGEVSTDVVVEIAEPGTEGITYGVLTTAGNLSSPVASAISNWLFGAWRPSLSDAQTRPLLPQFPAEAATNASLSLVVATHRPRHAKHLIRAKHEEKRSYR